MTVGPERKRQHVYLILLRPGRFRPFRVAHRADSASATAAVATERRRPPPTRAGLRWPPGLLSSPRPRLQRPLPIGLALRFHRASPAFPPEARGTLRLFPAPHQLHNPGPASLSCRPRLPASGPRLLQQVPPHLFAPAPPSAGLVNHLAPADLASPVSGLRLPYQAPPTPPGRTRLPPAP